MEVNTRTCKNDAKLDCELLLVESPHFYRPLAVLTFGETLIASMALKSEDPQSHHIGEG
jgi:hypothetical protein